MAPEEGTASCRHRAAREGEPRMGLTARSEPGPQKGDRKGMARSDRGNGPSRQSSDRCRQWPARPQARRAVPSSRRWDRCTLAWLSTSELKGISFAPLSEIFACFVMTCLHEELPRDSLPALGPSCDGRTPLPLGAALLRITRAEGGSLHRRE